MTDTSPAAPPPPAKEDVPPAEAMDVEVEGTTSEPKDVPMPPAPPLKTHVFGLDLGAQRCVVAASNGQVVLNELGGMTTATLVAFKGTERLIGEAAVLSASTNPQNTVSLANVLLGRSVEAIQARMDRVPGQHAVFRTRTGGSEAVVEVTYGAEDAMTEFSTEQVVAMLLGKLLEQMEKRVTDSEELIHVNIAVPAGWGEAERHALRVAAKIAGIPSMAIVSRGDSLARCFHCKHPLEAPAEGDAPVEPRHIAIVDMGHTSTSVAVIKLTPDQEQVLAIECDVELGSENCDLRLYEHFKEEIRAKMQLEINDHSKEGKRLVQACEKLKKVLSTIAEANVAVENIASDRDFKLHLTRETFERLCANESQRVHDLVAKALEATKLDVAAFASVEIVGGGTRVPFVQSAIMSVFPDRDASFLGRMLDSTTSVAVGAAHIGYYAEAATAAFSAEETAIIDQLTASETEMKARDAEIAGIAHERNAIEAFVYEMRSKRDGKHGDKIDMTKLNPLLDAAEDWIYSEESENATLESMRAKLAEIQTSIHEACSEYFAAVDADEKALEAHLEEEARRAEAERAAEGADDHDSRKLKKPERMRLVTKNKDEGNELFRDGNYQHAAMRYIKALSHASKFFDLSEADVEEVNKLKLSLYLNLAQCYIKLEQWGKAVANCKDALAIDPKNPKALYRRAVAYDKDKKLDDAVADIKAALKIAPDDKAIQRMDERLKLQLKRQLAKEKKMWGRAFA